MNNVNLIKTVLEDTNRTWKINGEYKVPETKHIEMMLDRARVALKKEENNSSFESGGIIVTRDINGHLDVYVHVGELTDLDEVEPE